MRPGRTTLAVPGDRPEVGDAASCTGRFAPSPTGPLHFGSLTTALASHLQARSRAGRWLVRIEDLDPPREIPGAADEILRALERLHLHWDGEVLRQSTRSAAYEQALERLAEHTYRCTCSRREIAEAFERLGLRGPPRYPGTCRGAAHPPALDAAIRFEVDARPVQFADALQGPYRCVPSEDFGDFVLRRRDGLFAYQLAVVVDDEAQGVTEVVRGTDLLGETPKQLLLQRCLGLRTPAYMHVPVATHPDGQKLSKQSGAAGIDTTRPAAVLVRALMFLRQGPPQHLIHAAPHEVLAWATAHWRPERLAGLRTIPLN